MSFAVGSLVTVRDREWVVLPESTDDLLMLRPLGGYDEEITGVLPALEKVTPSKFKLPNPEFLGDHHSCKLLRDAFRLNFRNSAGPFRSFGKIAVDPRPYQLVPLLIALKNDPVRILIADDVGIGKTIEALLIARELLDRGEVTRTAVLCPPHLAEQWQKEMKSKFNLEAELVLPSTASKLERKCGAGQSLFEVYPHVVVSMDYIKAERRRNDFVRFCPELVMVDEAHTCTHDTNIRSARHQRHQLVKGLTEDENRHVIFLTATPHSGKEDAFQELIGMLSPDLRGTERQQREELANYMVQRRRGDIKTFLGEDTLFPEREEVEQPYSLSDPYRILLHRVFNYASEMVYDPGLNRRNQRIRWWSILALLRSLASSPAAAAQTLRNRAAGLDTESEEQADKLGREAVMDADISESIDGMDVVAGSDDSEISTDPDPHRERLESFAKEAESLFGEHDNKLNEIVKIVKKDLLKKGFHPIIFCRFIPTAEYVAEALRSALPKKIEVACVTGTLPPAEREERVDELGNHEKRVLVCTDCLSEGINLQDHFNAVVHYDLSWNPTRHEQREGRVDRYGQKSPVVRALTYYGKDNLIDGMILKVLLKKHKEIRKRLGVSVPVPAESDDVIQTILESILEQKEELTDSRYLPGLEPTVEELYLNWDKAEDREKASRSRFAQRTIKPDEVEKELKEVRESIGGGVAVKDFVLTAFRSNNAVVDGEGEFQVHLSNQVDNSLRDSLPSRDEMKIGFSLPVSSGVEYVHRTHPIVETLASHMVDTALEDESASVAKRCGAIRTSGVTQRTTLLLLRARFQILKKKEDFESALLAEDTLLAAFTGAPDNPQWLKQEEAEELLALEPSGNIYPDQIRPFMQQVIENHNTLLPHLNQLIADRGRELLDAHIRVRKSSGITRVRHEVEPQLPPDILGVYLFIPVPGGAQ